MVMTASTQSCAFQEIGPRLCKAIITIPAEQVNNLYHETALDQKDNTNTHGFIKGQTPLSYIKEHYKSTLTEHLKEFFFKYCVLSQLYKQLHESQTAIAGEPRLEEIILTPDKDALFIFEISLSTPIEFRDWKALPFKAPKRKNYKDIDRQVELFIKEEEQFFTQYASDLIQIGDWICFDIMLLDKMHRPLLGTHREHVWLKIGNEEADGPFQELFLSKKIGDEITSSSSCLQEYFSTQLDTNYFFKIIILDRIPASHFSFDLFKHHFRIKNTKEMHQKLIEVFSFRNDISQRRMMAEESLKLLISKHQIDVPHYLVLRQQKSVLESVRHNPDYHVYKTENAFKDMIKQLALKQARELLFIDQMAYHEDISVTHDDIKSYLNLLKRARTKEFVYFNPPPTKIQGQEMPLPSEILKRCCLREKTLNHVIYHLTRK
jgi:FKBP-type peptidyl-prolyl cis-trans isomerase (trigger factor)